MKFDDSDPDYFLHDFSQQETPQQSDTPAAPSDRSPAFDFSQAPSAPSGAATKPKRRRGCFWFFFIIFIIAASALYVRYFIPYISESSATGFVTLVEKRGIIFHTFEAEMVSEYLLTDTARIYTRDIYFSIPDDSLARALMKYQASGRPVTITCKRYYGTLPWRGASNTILTSFTPATSD